MDVIRSEVTVSLPYAEQGTIRNICNSLSRGKDKDGTRLHFLHSLLMHILSMVIDVAAQKRKV